MAAGFLEKTGYDKFAASKTRQEKFLLDMAEDAEGCNGEDILDSLLFSPNDISNAPLAEVLIAADEFNNFIGQGNTDFMSILCDFWDFGDKVYKYKLKNSKSVNLNRPTVSILGGNTATGMNMLFPQEALGQGFFSRCLIIHSKPTGRKITWMKKIDEELEVKMVKAIQEIGTRMIGELTLTPESDYLLDKIYKTWKPIEDVRFVSYSNRRFSTLLKLVLIICANDLSHEIRKEHVIYANTLLTAAEANMPLALGEFGKGRNSDITHKVLKLIESTVLPITVKNIWKHVYTDLERREQLFEILSNLMLAEKIQEQKGGYLPQKSVTEQADCETLDWTLLTPEERNED